MIILTTVYCSVHWWSGQRMIQLFWILCWVEWSHTLTSNRWIGTLSIYIVCRLFQIARYSEISLSRYVCLGLKYTFKQYSYLFMLILSVIYHKTCPQSIISKNPQLRRVWYNGQIRVNQRDSSLDSRVNDICKYLFIDFGKKKSSTGFIRR